ncbi:hypothetical protein VP01_2990g4 [Puccinia sorghi]|uniref:Reverse transcriptase Ty1/copia-type domain-containing protein n=1 Tax=Puccinia sorghi TaxID=27349 RepID=A0A0L6V0K8_9BASI|nr:hypothetical protein VP01_2990g4 [Puccinia sorghi]
MHKFAERFKSINNRIHLTQPKHINHGLEELGLTKCKPSSTRLTPNLQLRESSDKDHVNFKKDSTLTTDLLLAYLKFTIDPVKPSEFLSIYSDATWGDDPDTMTSQSGYLCYLFGWLISWNSCRQRSIPYSSTEAELNPLVESFHEGVWLKSLINEMWNIQVNSEAHFIDDAELNQILTVDDKTLKERYCTNHLIDNKGLNDKLKKFRSNSKTQHIDLRTKGL